MMAEKVFDLCVAVSKFKDTAGKERNRYQHIGAELVNEEGKHFIILDAWVNLAGLPLDSRHNSVFVSKFPPRHKSETRGHDNTDESDRGLDSP
jgi:hypothetical protein